MAERGFLNLLPRAEPYS